MTKLRHDEVGAVLRRHGREAVYGHQREFERQLGARGRVVADHVHVHEVGYGCVQNGHVEAHAMTAGWHQKSQKAAGRWKLASWFARRLAQLYDGGRESGAAAS